MSSTEDRRRSFAMVVTAMLSCPGVSHGHGRRGFGSNALTVHGKIFCMETRDGRFVVKLPADRVRKLVQSGIGTGFRMAGRAMKEWMACGRQHDARWNSLAHEAYLFASKPDDSACSVPRNSGAHGASGRGTG